MSYEDRDLEESIQTSLDEAFLALSNAVKRISQAPNLTATDLNILISAYNSLKDSTSNKSDEEIQLIEQDIRTFQLKYNLPQVAITQKD